MSRRRTRRANPLDDCFNSPACDAGHGHKSRRVRNHTGLGRRSGGQKSKQPCPKWVLWFEFLPRFRDVTHDGLATFHLRQTRDFLRGVPFRAQHCRAKSERLGIVTERGIQQRDGEFCVRKLFYQNLQRRKRVAIVIIIAAPLDGEPFQTCGVESQLARLSQQWRKVSCGPKFSGQGWRIHCVPKVP